MLFLPMARGFIYIMSNPSFSDDYVKIGKSKGDPNSFRKKELYSTGVPQPFKVEYSAFVKKFDEVELAVHEALSEARVNRNREFFEVSVPDAIYHIRKIAGKIDLEKVYYKSKEEIEEIQRQKDNEERQKRWEIERLASERRIQEEKRKELNEEKRKDNWEKIFFWGAVLFFLSMWLTN